MGKKTHDAVMDASLDLLAEADQMNVCSAEPGTYYEACDPPAWQASNAYSLGDPVRPTARTGYVFECTTAGTSGGSEPGSWPTTPGNTQADGSVTWTCRANYALAVGALTVGEFTKANGDTDGRKTTLAAQTGLNIHTSGDATHAATVDDALQEYRDVTTCATQGLTEGGTVDTNAVDHEIADTT